MGLGVLGLGGCIAAGLALRPHRWLTVAFGDGAVSLDPHRGDRGTGWSVLLSFYEPLVAMTPELEPAPALAESWEQLDPTHWRFRLRPGVLFHDGARLTSRDVVASFDRARNLPASAVREYLTCVRSVRTAGDDTVVIESDRPTPNLLRSLEFVLVVPVMLARRDLITRPIGTGPYRFVAQLDDGTVVARAWWGWQGRPQCRNVRFEFLGTNEAALARLLAGRADVCHLVPDDAVADVARVPGLRVERQPRLAVQMLSVDLSVARGEARRALADPRVRRALLLGLDRGRWIDELFHGNGLVASQYVHPSVFGYDPSLSPPPYDPVAARRLLAEAGFPGGFAVALGHDRASADVAAAIARDLASIGVRVELRPGLRQAPLLYFSWACSTGDASDFLNCLIRSHHRPAGAAAMGFADPETDALLERADHETRAERRLGLLQEAQRRTLESLPILPLTIRWGNKGVSSRVEVVNRFDEREVVASFGWRD